MQSVPITTNIVSMNPTHGKVYSISTEIRFKMLEVVHTNLCDRERMDIDWTKTYPPPPPTE